MKMLRKLLILSISFFIACPLFAGAKDDLLKAVKDNSTSDVKKLISRNSSLVNLRYDDMKNTILMIALENECNSVIIEMILKAGCSPDAKNVDGQTALMIACKNEYGKKVIDQLIGFNVLSKSSKIKRITREDLNGKNSLDYAKNNPDAYKILDEYLKDADIKEKNKQQKEEKKKEKKAEQKNVVTEEQQPQVIPETTPSEQITQINPEVPPVAITSQEQTPELSKKELRQKEKLAKKEQKEKEKLAKKEQKQKEKDLKQKQKLAQTINEQEPISTQIQAEYVPEQPTLEKIPQIEEKFLEPSIVVTEIPTEQKQTSTNQTQEEQNPLETENKTEITLVEESQEEQLPTPEIQPEKENQIEVPTQEITKEKPELQEKLITTTEQSQNNDVDKIALDSIEIKDSTIPSETKHEPSSKSINSTINIPQIDYYNRNMPEYLFEELENNVSSIKQNEFTNPDIIENPDILDNYGRTKLINAIIENDTKSCFNLLSSGANVNFKDKDGWTPLMYACKYANNIEIIKLLIAFDANLNDKNLFNTSTLEIMATHCKNIEVLSFLLECAKNKKIDISNSFIMALKQERNVEIIKEYTKFIPNINFLKKGKTPLMYASEYYEQTDVIKFLLENGADPYIISSEKKNAFSYAKENAKIVKDSVYWSLNVSALNKR